MQSQTSATRPLGIQIVLEALAGCAAGIVCGAALGFVAARLFAGGSGGWGDLIGAVLGSIVGYTLGASLGVWAAGRRLGGRSTYWLSLLGSISGAAAVLLLAEPLRLNATPLLLQSALALIVPLAAALTMNMAPARPSR
jgi:hypothetical protein